MLVSTNDVGCVIVRMHVGCWACASYYECTISHSAPYCSLFVTIASFVACRLVMSCGCSCFCIIHRNVLVVCLGGCLYFSRPPPCFLLHGSVFLCAILRRQPSVMFQCDALPYIVVLVVNATYKWYGEHNPLLSS